MADHVKVADVRTIERFRAKYANAVEAFGLALQDAESDVEHTLVWLDAEIAPYWQKQLRKAQDQVVICKSALFRKQEIKSTPDARPSVVTERKALEKARARAALCEEKIQRVRHWKNELPRQAIIFKGALSPMAAMLDRDAPHIMTLMRRMTEHLEEYLRTSNEETERLLEILEVVSVARGGDAASEGPADAGAAPSPDSPPAEPLPEAKS